MWARCSKYLALVLSTSDVMIDLSERPMYPEIGNCDLFSDAHMLRERNDIDNRLPHTAMAQRRKVTPSIIGR